MQRTAIIPLPSKTNREKKEEGKEEETNWWKRRGRPSKDRQRGAWGCSPPLGCCDAPLAPWSATLSHSLLLLRFYLPISTPHSFLLIAVWPVACLLRSLSVSGSFHESSYPPDESSDIGSVQEARLAIFHFLSLLSQPHNSSWIA